MHPSTAVGQSPATLKWLWIAVGALGASVLALGGTLLAQNLHSDAPMAQPVQESTQRAEISKQKPPQTVLQQAHAAPDSRANQLAARPARLPEHPSQPVAQARPAAPVCASCGHVESVQALEQAAPATGLGAVAGGVLGGVLGNQVGKGSGRTAATVLGAVGGGYVGHKVEERARSSTVYQMRVRMQDGSVRNFARAQPVAEGTPVRLEGKGFRVDDGAGATERPGARPVYVNDRAY